MPDVMTADYRSTRELEFVALFASLTSLTALALSMTLPALSDIDRAFSAGDGTHRVVSALVLGMVFGELFFGPLADARGRKTAIIVGIMLFVVGSLIALFASSLEMLLFARVLQGFGVAGPKIGSRAASLINAKLVLRLGTVRLVRTSLLGLVTSSGALLSATLLSNGVPSLLLFLGLCASCFFCIGILFGNLGAMAMESLGAVAGIGASIIASVSSLVAVLVSDVVGSLHDTTLVPLSICFVTVGIATLVLVESAVRRDDVVVFPNGRSPA